MIIFIWLLIVAVCLFSASVIWQGVKDAWWYWREKRTWFFEILEPDSNLNFYNGGKSNSFSWSFDLPWYCLDLEYTPGEWFGPYLINHRIAGIKTLCIGWFTLDITRLRR